MTFDHLTKDLVDYRNLPTKVSKQIIKRLVSTWTGYFEVQKEWKKNPTITLVSSDFTLIA
ncbi:hypothetical protein FJR41_022465 [Dolichospermum planctonicum UHCC 0167]|uniref:hypothetical protein n=1 Tax=Dolichospermum planctonicum TaxID=136072 RepID=UPI0014437EA6|nr:hypothetical protein [Dolichospermum planctonicum]MCW9683525.1 hypothetical protein [Dolichospermum planctonicum UHCC 0167]